MLNILIFILIFSSFDVIQSEFTCSIENKNKIKCLPDMSNAAGNLEINCVRVGCCYQKVEEDGYPFCYYNTTIPTTIVTFQIFTTIPTTVPTKIPTTIPTTIIYTIPTTIPTTIIYTIPTTIPRTIPEISNNIQNDHFQNMTQIAPTIKINQNNLSYCSMDEVINNTCTKGKMNLNEIDNIKDYLKNNIGEREDGLYKKITTGNVVIQFATVEEQKNANDLDSSSIDLGEDCENKIRNTNNIVQIRN